MGVRLTDDCKGEILYLRMLFLACDLGLAKDRGRVGAGDKRVNITAFSSGDRVGKFLEVTLPQS